jgi:hypothetical protein
MTSPLAVDTNVLVVANRQNTSVTQDCLLAAREAVATIALNGTICIDSDGAVIMEYSRQIDAEARPQDISARVLIWLRQNRYSDQRIKMIDVGLNSDGEYSDCPKSLIAAGFDVSDRKFVAIARRANARVVNATDSDWIEHSELLRSEGIRVDNLCGCDEAMWFNP